MSLIKVVPYVLGVTKMPSGLPHDAPEPRMYPHSGYFLVYNIMTRIGLTRNYPLSEYILGSGAPGTPRVMG